MCVHARWKRGESRLRGEQGGSCHEEENWADREAETPWLIQIPNRNTKKDEEYSALFGKSCLTRLVRKDRPQLGLGISRPSTDDSQQESK